MQSSTPNGQFAHPNYSVHALKPLTKILSFGALARKPVRALRRIPPRKWSTDVKYRGLGLIGAESADFCESRGSAAAQLTFGVGSAREPGRPGRPAQEHASLVSTPCRGGG